MVQFLLVRRDDLVHIGLQFANFRLDQPASMSRTSSPMEAKLPERITSAVKSAHPAGQDPEAGPRPPPVTHSNAPFLPESQSILSKIVAHWMVK